MKRRVAVFATLGTAFFLGCGIELDVAPDLGADAQAPRPETGRSDAAARDANVAPQADAQPDGVADAAGDAVVADAETDDAAPDVRVPPVVVSMVARPMADRVNPGDGPIVADGEDDGVFEVVLHGPVIALALLHTNAAGMPTGNEQWDTYVGADVPPAGLAPGIQVGSDSYQLGVFEGATLQNDATGRFARTDAAERTLQIYGSDVGSFETGTSFRLWVESPEHELVAGPVLTLP